MSDTSIPSLPCSREKSPPASRDKKRLSLWKICCGRTDSSVVRSCDLHLCAAGHVHLGLLLMNMRVPPTSGRLLQRRADSRTQIRWNLATMTTKKWIYIAHFRRSS